MALILGLDVRKDVVRGVVAKVTTRGTEVLRYVEEATLPTTTPEARTAAARDAITALLGTLSPAPERVVTRLSGVESTVRVMSLPKAAMRRAHEVLPFELDAALPYDAQDAVVDYQVIDEKRGAEVPLLVACAPKERVRTHLDALRGTGVSPREVAAGAAALDGLVNVIPALAVPELVVVLDAGRDQTDVLALRGGVCIFARTVAATMEDARTGRLAAELKQTLLALKASGEGDVSTVYLTGEAADDEHATGWFGEKLGVPVSPLALPAPEGASEPVRGGYAAALALACRAAGRRKRINLRRGDLVQEAGSGDTRKYLRPVAIGAAVVLAAFAFSVFAKWRSLEAEHEILAAQLEKVTERAFGEATRDVDEAEALIEGRSSGGNPLPKLDAYDALEAISARIPSDIVHDVRKLVIELEDDGQTGRFELRGAVASIAERDRIATSLGAHECFKDLKNGPTTAAPGGKGIAYPIEGKLRCPGVRDPKAAKPAGGARE